MHDFWEESGENKRQGKSIGSYVLAAGLQPVVANFGCPGENDQIKSSKHANWAKVYSGAKTVESPVYEMVCADGLR